MPYAQAMAQHAQPLNKKRSSWWDGAGEDVPAQTLLLIQKDIRCICSWWWCNGIKNGLMLLSG